MPIAIARLLDTLTFTAFARIVLTLPFWAAGLYRLWGFSDGVLEMRGLGFEPAALTNGLVIFTLLGGSLLVVINRRAWAGAGALGILTLMTIPLAHPFWDMSGDQAALERLVAFGHVGLIGGLMLAAALSRHAPLSGA